MKSNDGSLNGIENCSSKSTDLERVARERFRKVDFQCRKFADKIFVAIFVMQYIGAVGAAIYVSPQTWIGANNQVHFHVWLSIIGGAVISVPPILLSLLSPGARLNQYVNACAQVVTSSLLVHLCGGRIETHFHVFGSMAFLSLYRNWTVLVPATLIVAVDHALRGIYWPESAFGIAQTTSWRWLEHAAWLLFENVVLGVGTIQARHSLRLEAAQWAELSITKLRMGEEVQKQVAEIAENHQLLKHQDRRMTRIIDSAQDGFAILDLDGKVKYWSGRASALFGWDCEEALGRRLDELLKCEYSEAFKLSDISSENRRGVVEATATTKSEESLIIEMSYFVNDDDSSLEINAFLHDITKRKSVQMQLSHLRKMESIGQLAAGIAHEINTPSQFIGDNLDFIEESFEDVFGVLEQIESMSATWNESDRERLAPLVERFERIDYSYLQDEVPKAIAQAKDGNLRVGTITKAMKEFSHPGSIDPVQVDLAKLIDNSLLVCRNAWKSEANVTWDIDPEIGPIDCYANELSQSIINLVVNSAQAICEHRERTGSMDLGKIDIAVQKTESLVEIRVRDNGPGIPESIRSRIFDPFFTTKEVGKGSGQGLAITYSAIVDRHRGSIEVESEIGKGTVFILRFPTEIQSRTRKEVIHHA